MRRLTLACLLILSPSLGRAQVQVHIDIGLPVAPPLVVVQPGIQVVEGFDDEVFFHRGWYWCRRPNGWYRSRTPQARFAPIAPRYVPRSLVRVPPGHYRNWHHDARPLERREAAHERRDERREERREDRREERRDDRRDERSDRGHGHGRGHRNH